MCLKKLSSGGGYEFQLERSTVAQWELSRASDGDSDERRCEYMSCKMLSWEAVVNLRFWSCESEVWTIFGVTAATSLEAAPSLWWLTLPVTLDCTIAFHIVIVLHSETDSCSNSSCLRWSCNTKKIITFTFTFTFHSIPFHFRHQTRRLPHLATSSFKSYSCSCSSAITLSQISPLRPRTAPAKKRPTQTEWRAHQINYLRQVSRHHGYHYRYRSEIDHA